MILVHDEVTGVHSLKLIASSPPENRPKLPQKEMNHLNQPLIFRGELLVSGRIYVHLILSNLCDTQKNMNHKCHYAKKMMCHILWNLLDIDGCLSSHGFLGDFSKKLIQPSCGDPSKMVTFE